MAKDKNSFILYCDFENVFEEMTDAQAGKLIKHIFRYVNDKNPELKDRLLKIAFEPIKQHLKRDLKRWEKSHERRVEAGKRGGIKSGESRNSEAMLHSSKQSQANEAVSGSVSVSVNGSASEREDAPPIFPIEHCLVVALNDPRWVKANKATEADLKEFNGLLEKRGIYTKNPLDYKTHFANWRGSGKSSKVFNDLPTGPILKKL